MDLNKNLDEIEIYGYRADDILMALLVIGLLVPGIIGPWVGVSYSRANHYLVAYFIGYYALSITQNANP